MVIGGGVVGLTAGLQTTTSAFNPIFEVITFGPWIAGRVVRSRRQLAAKIQERNHELDNERARSLYARLGFLEYGVEKNALKQAGRYYDEVLMAKNLLGPST